MHGPHQVAQKSTSTTLPFQAVRSNASPSSVVPRSSIVLPGSFKRRIVPAILSVSASVLGSVRRLAQRGDFFQVRGCRSGARFAFIVRAACMAMLSDARLAFLLVRFASKIGLQLVEFFGRLFVALGLAHAEPQPQATAQAGDLGQLVVSRVPRLA